ncbi:MAG: hypothetical protein K2N23_05905 [Clostridia bacterium]|nr:hypothetical protein [Clostridia bacterium]
MKKLLALLLILCVMLTFAGCGGNSDSLPDGTQSGSETQQPDEGKEEKPNDAQQPEEGKEPPEEKPNEGEVQQPDEGKEITAMYLYINDNKLEVTLAKNKAVTALVEILKNGDITYTANDYGGFEIVGSLGHSLPTENSEITTEAGDVILYSGNQIVLFYGSNEWSYTRLGKINGYSVSELRSLLGAGKGSVQVRISLK